MEAVEITVYLGIAIILGVMVLHFLTSWDFIQTYENMQSAISGKSEPKFTTVDIDEFVGQSLNLWDSCGLGEVNKSVVLYVDDKAGELNKTVFFKKVKVLNLCGTLQSVSQSCGTIENVYFIPAVITLPHIVQVSCNVTNEVLVIKG